MRIKTPEMMERWHQENLTVMRTAREELAKKIAAKKQLAAANKILASAKLRKKKR